MTEHQDSSLRDKIVVAGTAFCCSCASFGLSLLLLIPLLGTLLQAIAAPDIVQQSVVVFCLFGIPIAGAIGGIVIGDKLIQSAETA